MKTFVGIDLGSTTTTALLLAGNSNVPGRGLARQSKGGLGDKLEGFLAGLERAFRLEQFIEQLGDREQTCLGYIQGERFVGMEKGIRDGVAEIFIRLREEAPSLYPPGAKRKSDFFRDIAGSRFPAQAEDVAGAASLPYDLLVNLSDKSITEGETRAPGGNLSDKFHRALRRLLSGESAASAAAVQKTIEDALNIELDETYLVGTGYARGTLPVSKEHIRSEILCHGLGTHMMDPKTRTVLDIGGQDTKGIQIDPNGIVENFQMNDPSAAGCGRS